MTKTITAFIVSLVLLCNVLSGQCVSDPEEGLVITKSVFLCGDVLDGYTSTLPSVNSPIVGNPASLCTGFAGGGGKPDNILWFSFIATGFSFDIDIMYDNCGPNPLDRIQAGIYGDLLFDEVLACYSDAIGSSANLQSNSAVPGKIYYLFIDGYDSSVCDFEIVVNNNSVRGLPYTFEWKDDISGISGEEDGQLVQNNQNVCVGNNLTQFYEAPICEAESGPQTLPNFNSLDLFCYEWTITPAGSGTIIGDENKREIEVDWQLPGDYTISVEITPSREIGCGDLCLTADEIEVSVRGITSMTAPDTIFFCADDPPTYCGTVITRDTSMVCIENSTDCVEVLQEFVLLVNDTTDHGTFVNCGSTDCFEMFGFPYCTPMDYVIPDPSACNLYHRFTIEGFNIDIDIAETLSLDCANSDLVLEPNIITNYTGRVLIEYYTGGALVGSGATLSVNGTGSYEIRVNFPDLASSCATGSKTVEVVESMDAPAFSIINPLLTCANPSARIEFVEVDAVSGILWEGTNGFTSTDNSFMTNEIDSFKLTITGMNGCTNDTTFVVGEDKESAVVELSYEDLTCLVVETEATYDADRSIMQVDWLRNDGVSVSADTLAISSPGDYGVTFTASNGCITIVPFSVLENIEMPTADAGMDQMWQCNTKQLTIDGAVSSGPVDIEWSVVENGLIRSDKTLPKIDVGSEGTYILNVTNRESGCEVSDSATVFRNENVPDSMETAVLDPSCFDTTDGLIQVINVDGGTLPFRYFLNGIQTEEDFIDDLSAGVYSLQVLDNFDCRLEVSIVVEEQPEIVLNVPASVTIGYSELYTLWALHNLVDTDVQAINWYDADGNLIGEGDSLNYKTNDDTSISVEVINQNGCAAVRTIPVEVDINVPVFAPNVFSPNNDGVNDKFTLFANNDYPTQVNSLSIFDRWGAQVYHVEDLSFGDEDRGWDGKRNGQVLQSAVYVYTAEVGLVDGTTKIVKGEVMLLR